VTAPLPVQSSTAPPHSGHALRWCAALGLAALALRAFDLGRLPLDPPEAAAALAAWSGLPPQTAPLHHGLLALFGPAAAAAIGADAAARLPSATAGALAAGLCLCLRGRQGARAAACAAVLFAVAPWWLDMGRHAGPAPIGLAVVLGTAIAYGRGRHALASALAGAAFAAGLVAQTALLAAAIAGGARLTADRLVRARSTVGETGRLGVGGTWSMTRRPLARIAAAIAGYACAASALGSWPTGIVAWGTGMQPSGALAPGELPSGWPSVGLLLVVYAPLITAFGAAGLARGLVRGRSVDVWLAAWLGVAGLAATRGDAVAAASALLAPLTLGAGVALADLGAALRRRGAWSREGVVSGIALGCCAYALVRFAYFAERGAAGNVDPVDSLALARYGLALAGLPIAAAALLWGRAAAVRTFAVSAALALAAAGASNGAALLNGRHLELARRERTESGARFLAEEARRRAPSVALGAEVEPAVAWALLAAGVDAAGDAQPLRTGEGITNAARVVVSAAGEPGAWRTVTRWRPRFADEQAFARWYLQRRDAVSGRVGTIETAWARLEEDVP